MYLIAIENGFKHKGTPKACPTKAAPSITKIFLKKMLTRKID